MTIILKGQDSIDFIYTLCKPTKKTILENARYFEELEKKYKIKETPNGFESECKDLDLDFLKGSEGMNPRRALEILEKEKNEVRKELQKIEETRKEAKVHSWLSIDESKVKKLTDRYDALDLSINHLKRELANEKENH